MRAASEAAIRSCDHTLVTEQRGESLNPLRYERRMFHNIRLARICQCELRGNPP